jgi:predicted nucleic acid-binding Zn ribbon protein
MTDGDSVFRLRDLLGDVGRGLGLRSPVETGMVWSRWTEIVGASVAAHAEPSSLKAGVLRVRADSPTWASEIGYLSDEIKVAVNRTVGMELVEEVRVWTGPTTQRTPGHRGSRQPTADPRARTATEVPADPNAALERAREAWLRRGRGTR